MALAYDARRLTADIDAVFEPKSVVYNAIRYVASKHELADDWINAVHGQPAARGDLSVRAERLAFAPGRPGGTMRTAGAATAPTRTVDVLPTRRR